MTANQISRALNSIERPSDEVMTALERWDAAFDALSRRDYDEYDRITGFVMGDAVPAPAVALRVEPSFTVSPASPLPSVSQGARDG